MDPVKVEQDYAQVAAHDALFAPHAAVAFETLGQLGEGGMGTIYKVRDRRSGRLAALKVLLDPAADELTKARFLREATLTARLDHPAIPPVYEIGRTARGELFLLMRLIEGRTLKEEIESFRDGGRDPSEQRRLLQALIRVSEALAYAHAQGFVHRDVKPSNIMVGRFGEVLLLDWGIAKDMSSEQHEEILESALSAAEIEGANLTLSGGVVGTPGYMSPEQADGGDIDARTDIYALGLLLGEVLAGEPLVTGDNSMTRVVANIEGRYQKLDYFGVRAPRNILWIMEQALQKDLEERTESAEEFTEQLQAMLSDEPIPGYSQGLIERLGRLSRRHPAALTGVFSGILLFALVVLLNQAMLEVQTTGAALNTAETRKQEAEQQAAQASKQAARAKRVLELFNKAKSQARRGLQKALEQTINEALEASGRDEESLLTAAQIAREAKHLELAEQLLRECSESHKPGYRALYRLHEVLLGDRPFDGSPALKELVLRARARGDENEFTLFFEAMQQSSNNDYAGAVKTLNKAAGYTKSFAALYHNRGVARFKTDDVKGALEDIQRAIELEPTRARYYLSRGGVLKVLKKYRESLEDFDKAIELQPKLWTGYSARGRLYQVMKDPQKALSDFKQVIRLAPKEVTGYQDMGRLLWRVKQYRDALRCFEEAHKLKPRDTQLLLKKGALNFQINRVQRAIDDFNEALKIDDEFAAAYERRAFAYVKLGQAQAALRDFEQAIRFNPKLADSHAARGDLLRKLGRLEDALESYEASLKLAPKALTYNNRGLVYFLQKQDQRALADFNKAMELDPTLAISYASRASLLRVQGKLREALKDYQQFLRLAPEHPQAGVVKKRVQSLQRRLSGS